MVEGTSERLYITLAGKGEAPLPTVNMVRFPGASRAVGRAGPNVPLPHQAVPSHSLCLSFCFLKAGPARGRDHSPHTQPFLSCPQDEAPDSTSTHVRAGSVAGEGRPVP